MNGAESLVRTLVQSGVSVCFANPGTSEMHFVAALDKAPGMRAVLGLFEGVVTGMADGYGRLAGRPAATLLHLGTGLANGLANLHNARRAATPVVNIVGDHTRAHLQFNSPFISDVAAIARPFSDWVHTAESSLTLAADGARAVTAAQGPPGRIATLVVPADAAWNDAEAPATAPPRAAPRPVPESTIERIATQLGSTRHSALLLRGDAATARGVSAAGRIAARTGARLLSERLTPRLQRGAGRVRIEQIPYRVEDALESLRALELLILVSSSPPVSTFAYPGKPSWYLPAGCSLAQLAQPEEDAEQALEALAARLKSPDMPAGLVRLELPDLPRGALDQFTLGACIARHLPEGAILVDEGVTNSPGTFRATETAAPHDYFSNSGGALGQGLPLAAGAAVGAPERKVVCLQADGGAMYSVQSLWTLAREQLDVTVVIISNRAYAILQMELARVGATMGANARALLDLATPELSWTRLAQGMGVEASRADTAEQFDAQFSDAVRRRGPRLIEAMIQPRA
ncbi:MAG TPA: acetolactate synthase large subunit [Steroidobacteraceae bacterium]|nr:acetolactate synthase large subunit [Steroidobacteraceae bacterium]